MTLTIEELNAKKSVLTGELKTVVAELLKHKEAMRQCELRMDSIENAIDGIDWKLEKQAKEVTN
jgi:butyrate kinase